MARNRDVPPCSLIKSTAIFSGIVVRLADNNSVPFAERLGNQRSHIHKRITCHLTFPISVEPEFPESRKS